MRDYDVTSVRAILKALDGDCVIVTVEDSRINRALSDAFGIHLDWTLNIGEPEEGDGCSYTCPHCTHKHFMSSECYQCGCTQ